MSKDNPIVFNHKNADHIMPAYVLVDRTRFRFNKAAQEMCGMRVGKRIHLVYFGDYEAEKWTENEWFFIVDDDKNGVELAQEGRSSMVAHNSPIASKFLRHALSAMPNRYGNSSMGFLVERTKKEWKGKKMFHINIYNTYISPKSRLKNKPSEE